MVALLRFFLTLLASPFKSIRLPVLAAELVRRHVTMITAGGNRPAQAAKKATATIPIVFTSGADPVRSGLVASLSRPGGNLTGISFIAAEMAVKRLELMHELLPQARAIAMIVNPNFAGAETEMAEVETAGRIFGLQTRRLAASSTGELDAAFATLGQQRVDAVMVGTDGFFIDRRDQIAALATRYKVAGIFPFPDFPAAGGLMSYGASRADGYRQAGVYTGRVLKGAKPADLPIMQPTKFELVINLEAAKAIGLTISPVDARPRRRGDRMKRREFITLLGGAAAWPLAARAQQPAMPVIGFLGASSPETNADSLRAFHLGLKETGYVEGDNVTILYRWAESHLDRLPELAADLARRRVSVLANFGNAPALAAKAATTTVPIVFAVSEDPVKFGLVASLARPGGNLTGVNFLSAELAAKRLELLRELVPGAVKVAVLVDPAVSPTATTLQEVEMAAGAMGLQIQILNASSSGEINTAFATLARERPDALFVGPGFLFTSRRVQLVNLAALHKVPATYSHRQYPEIGGLMSYGTNYLDVYRQVGVYAGRILKGAKPVDLPVVQSTKFELVINAETARMLGLTVPPTLLSVADEVIE